MGKEKGKEAAADDIGRSGLTAVVEDLDEPLRNQESIATDLPLNLFETGSP
jgi:hypothetical protein